MDQKAVLLITGLLSLIFLLSFILLLKAVYKDNTKRILIFKTLCSFLFLLFGLMMVWYSGTWPQAYSVLILLGLTVSIAGDVFLVYTGRRTFILGLSSFFAAQVMYNVAFIIRGGFGWRNILIFMILSLFLALILNSKRFFQLGDLKLPANLYMLVLCFMVSNAVSGLIHSPPSLMTSYILTSIGALLFLISDFLLACEKFLINPPKHMEIFVLATYYPAQILIACGILTKWI